MELRPPAFDPMFWPGTRYRWSEELDGLIEVADGGCCTLPPDGWSPATRPGDLRSNGNALLSS
jgi:hypothetical protein